MLLQIRQPTFRIAQGMHSFTAVGCEVDSIFISFFYDDPVRSVVGVARRVSVNLRLDCVWEGRPKAWCMFRCLFPYGSPRFTDCTIWQLHFRCVIWCFPPSNKRKRQVELNSGRVGTDRILIDSQCDYTMSIKP